MRNNFIFNYQVKTYLYALLLIFFIIFDTGYYGDDFVEFGKDFSFRNRLYHVYPYIFISYFQHFWLYSFFDISDQNLVFFLKSFYLFLSIILLSKFLEFFFDKFKSLFLAFVIIFFPSHDTTVFWYMTIPYYFVSSLILFSFYLFLKKKNFLAHLALLLSTFSFLGCVPYFISLAILSLVTRNVRFIKYYLFYTALFLFFYATVSYLLPESQVRINTELNLFEFIKNNIIWLVSLFDSILGIGFFYKIYLVISNINLITFILSSIFIILFFLFFDKIHVKNSRQLRFFLFFSLCLIFFSSFMYSLTGTHFNSAFNLTNRTNYVGSFFIIGLACSVINNRKVFNILFITFILISFCLSDHWKNFNNKQINFIKQISNNQDLQKLNDKSLLISHGLLFSELGNFYHIDFLRMEWVCKRLYTQYTSVKNVRCLYKDDYYQNSFFISKQNNRKIDLSKFSKIYMYNIFNNKLIEVKKKELQSKIINIKFKSRHWLEFDEFNFFENILNKLGKHI